MGIQFASSDWVKAVMQALNESDAYANAAKNWEGDFYFIVDKGDGIPETVYLYMDLWHGKCREALKAESADQKSPAFELSAPLKTWKGVLNKKIDPIQGLVTRKLKLKGPMVKVMKAPKAAIELVECCAGLDTDWPA
ncbi:MAG: SCP2 sterol-binding domain-containing protein [Anaerolineales bacterium]|nr:SCP2 sterol-binding domain-containing protein [Anaerolineales bacterium]